MTAALVKVMQTPPDHLGSWLTFVGAVGGSIIVAAIAAFTAQRRLNAQLASEERRHGTQLDFDRGESDRVELRSILDALAERLLVVGDAASEVLAVSRVYSELWDKGDEQEGRRTIRDARDRLQGERDKLAGNVQQLNLRLGKESFDLVLRVNQVRDGATLVWLPAQPDLPYGPDQLDTMDRGQRMIRTAISQFMTGAVTYTHARLMTMPEQTGAPVPREPRPSADDS